MPSPVVLPYSGVSPHVADLHIVNGRVEYRDPAQRRKKVAICGAGGVYTMPWEDPSFECWAINNFWNTARDTEGRIAASRWWEQHQILPDSDGKEQGLIIQDAQDMHWINTCPVPLYTTEPWPANPNATVWPIDYFAAKYRDYFTCTFAMQILQAFDEGFEELHIHGLTLLLGTKREATVESSCVNYWLGLVEGRGMKVVIRDGDFVLRHPYRYGHQYWMERRWVEQYIERWNTRLVAV